MRALATIVLGAVALCTTAATAFGQSASDIAVTCRTMKNTESTGEGGDYPGMFNTAWRCMNGSVYICEMGASGRACMRTGTSNTPHAGIRQYCRENPNADFVPGYLLAGAAITWRCLRGQPVIVETEGVDEQGYVKRFWRKVGP